MRLAHPEQLPVAHADGPVSEQFPPGPVCRTADGIAGRVQHGRKRQALQRRHRFALIKVRMPDARHVKDRGWNIHDMGDRVRDASASGHAFSGHDQRGANAAFGQEALEHAERAGAHLCPGRPILNKGAFLAPVRDRAVVPGRTNTGRIALGTVVRQENDQRVIVKSGSLEIADEGADVRIHMLDHARVKLHPARRVLPGLGGQVIPGGHGGKPGIDGGRRIKDAKRRHPRDPLRAYRVIALIVSSTIPVAPVIRQLKRIMRCLKGKIGKEGPAILPVLLDVVDDRGGVIHAGMKAGPQRPDRRTVIGVKLALACNTPHVIQMAAPAGDQRQVTHEPAGRRKLVGLFAHVPFPGHEGVIPGVLQKA